MRTAAIVLIVGCAALAQSPAPATIVSGRVIHALTKEPLAGAIAAATGAMPGVSNAEPDAAFLTNRDGHFVLRGVPRGSLNLSARKAGYLDVHLPAAVTVEPGSPVVGIILALTPSSLISGRVRDQAGDPVSLAAVRIAPGGEPLSSRAARSTTTDDRGWYVIDRLPAGEYVLGAARSAAGSMEIPDALVMPVAIATGEERDGVDLPVPHDGSVPESYPVGAGSGKDTSGRPPAGTASIAGTVRDAYGRGLPHLTVIASPHEEDAPTLWVSRTDERGGFVFQKLPAGSFVVQAFRAGRWRMAYGSTRPNLVGTPLAITNGEQRRGIDIVLRDPGAISGTIRDEFGDPVRAVVSLVGTAPTGGMSAIQRTTTDDRGRYRFGHLSPREYVVMTVRDPARSMRADDGAGTERVVGAAPVVYPGVPSAALATALRIELGTELQAIDITASHVPVSSVTLNVIAPVPFDALEAQQRALEETLAIAAPGRVRDHSVVFDGVSAGRWRFVASAVVATPRGPERHWASQEVTTDGLTAHAATLTLEPGGRVSGRFEFDGDGPPPVTAEVRLSEVVRSPNSLISRPEGTARIHGSGAFEARDLMPGLYVIEAADKRPGGTWSLKRATLNGRDVLDLPIELLAGSDFTGVVLTLTDRQTELTGTITDALGRPLAETDIVIVPADSRYRWLRSRRVQSVTTAPNGTYRVRGLPPGDYRIGLTADTAATTVTLTEGGKVQQNVKILRRPPP